MRWWNNRMGWKKDILDLGKQIESEKNMIIIERKYSLEIAGNNRQF